MTNEERSEIDLFILSGGWYRLLLIIRSRLGHPVKPHDKPTMADIIKADHRKLVTTDEMKAAYQEPGWADTAERIISQCRTLLAA